MKKRTRRLKSLTDLRRYLADTVNRFENGEIEESHLKSIAYVTNIMAGIIKDSDLEQRVQALENANQNSGR